MLQALLTPAALLSLVRSPLLPLSGPFHSWGPPEAPVTGHSFSTFLPSACSALGVGGRVSCTLLSSWSCRPCSSLHGPMGGRDSPGVGETKTTKPRTGSHQQQRYLAILRATMGTSLQPGLREARQCLGLGRCIGHWSRHPHAADPGAVTGEGRPTGQRKRKPPAEPDARTFCAAIPAEC